MKWRTHKAITRTVCSKLGIQAEEIANASVLPDKEPDYIYRAGRRRVYRVRAPHHGREALDLAFNYLKRARKAYLRGDRRYIEYLGRALHYVQDYSVDPKEKLWIFEYRSGHAHDERENGVARLHVPEEAVSTGFNEVCTPHRVKEIVYGAKPKKSPEEIMFLATYLSAIAVKSVFNPDKPPKLEENYSKALKIHVVLVLLPLLILLAGVTASTLALAAILSFVMHKLDFNYHRWKLEHDWFRP
ncbi:hypothetical protein AFULGI_00016630 [Archaeoglobus fulgidus DSM 8774]|uniref:Phospholipase C/D domain-containing protein n=1 Tax=Archaeoglobus fulgidus DSM 8774 TaxID=1344584 RepID=A0A075WF52_ARCFL|nr:hypothetical protein [Archaeoglobus fulgidus]AIG98422.1 hypothetical protein AFULGI_00016630 [Archaeoglobus fulgidus DSM 8774]